MNEDICDETGLEKILIENNEEQTETNIKSNCLFLKPSI